MTIQPRSRDTEHRIAYHRYLDADIGMRTLLPPFAASLEGTGTSSNCIPGWCDDGERYHVAPFGVGSTYMSHEPVQILLKHAVVVQAKVFDKLLGSVVYTVHSSG